MQVAYSMQRDNCLWIVITHMTNLKLVVIMTN